MGVDPRPGRRALVLAFLGLARVLSLGSEPARALATFDAATGLIGMTLEDAFALLGVPADVLAHRGEESWQDDVVFYFDDHLYLFWFRGRVWQARIDHRYAGVFMGFRMGDTRQRVVDIVARPFQEAGDSLVFFLLDASSIEEPGGVGRGSYPLRLRVYFRDGKLHDAYLYRGDF